MDANKQNSDKQCSYEQLPGSNYDIEYVGSQPIDEEDPKLAVREWTPLADVLEAINQTIGKLFPPRR
jgi:hypothetical protein